MKSTFRAFCLLIFATLGLSFAQNSVPPKDGPTVVAPLNLAQQLLETTMKSTQEAADKLKPFANKLHEEMKVKKPTDGTYDQVANLLVSVTGDNLIYEHLLDSMQALLTMTVEDLTATTRLQYLGFCRHSQDRFTAIRALLNETLQDLKLATPLLPMKKMPGRA